jgi:phage terminase large subunit
MEIRMTTLPGYDIENWSWTEPNYDLIYEARIARLERMRAQPEIVPRLWEHYAANPADFISDWGVTFDPRLAERGMRTVVPFVLFPKQREFIAWLMARWVAREDGVVEKSRDMGVSWLTVAFGAWMMIFRPGTVFAVGSRKEAYVDQIGNPSSLLWKAREFINLLPKEFQPPGWDPARHAPYMKIQNPSNGSFFVGEAGDAIGRGNRTSVYIVDEGAFLEHPEQADASLSQTSNCKIWVSTPNGVGNVFYRKAHDGKTPKFIFAWQDDPRKTPAWYEIQKSKLDPVILAQEVDRSYTASVSNAFIPGDVASGASRRGPADVIPFGPIMVGIDVARFGNDKTCFIARQGRVAYSLQIMGKVDVVDVAGRAREFINGLQATGRVGQVAVDTVGLGAGVADILRRDFGDLIEDVNSGIRLDDGQNYNLRARMWRDMREWLKAGASIPNDSELISDLTALQYGYRGGALLIESKDDAKKRGIKSPDRADALALTFAIPARVMDEFTAPVIQNTAAWAVLDQLSAY